MKLCIAGTNAGKRFFEHSLKELRFVLESHFYMQSWQAEQLKDIEHFMLDSGAFTFLNSKRNIDIEEYTDTYIDFINNYDIQYFLELDIDSVVGYEEVKRIRRKIERKTKKRCIPVWHKSRGIKDFKEMCRKYDYVAIGGIVTKEIPAIEHFLLNAFCDYAHSRDCKIHGLGFTPGDLAQYRFDSVDSTSWIIAGAYGRLYNFTGDRLVSSKPKVRMKRVEYDRHNIEQFLKYQSYLLA